MPDIGTATVTILTKTGKLEQELDALELQASRIQTRIEKALEDAQTLRSVLGQCEALTNEIKENS